MNPKFASKLLSFTGWATLAAFLVIVLLLPDGSAAGSESAVAGTAYTSSGIPVRLKVPRVGINALVELKGLTADGAMGVTEGPDDVAWFDRGVKPGENGTAVIAGHSGWKDGIPAAFDNLNQLHIGDEIVVENDEGISSTFRVREMRTYDPKADASSVFGSGDGKSHLNLITCEGVWDPVTKSTSERLVLFTDKV